MVAMASHLNHQATFPTLEGKVAIVTGASRGIGRGIALELARRGAKVVATYVSPNSAKAVQGLIGEAKGFGSSSDCVGVCADLRNAASAQIIVDKAVAAFGPHIDILVNNAAVEVVKPLEELRPSDFNDVYNVNILGPILLMQQVKPRLRQPGRIINIGSVGARSGFKNLSLYCSSKAALEGLTRCWAAELGADGHSVNVVNPGPVQSDMLDKIPDDIVSMQKATTPMQNRLGTFDDVAQIVAWLASEESRWVTGQAISASGGWAMY
ncbi:gluconate 5-dehydrogenase [Purpureocillium lavendulum]|uniref:Gluconate 5-dehydrogenase n=1 Tax=Purpureocillium lavendulum TaxID=1247861 RepID=A0AB34FUM3_9HYPO|nr:gluconate 5-dehydrogenase [Purpureocillium lavendulum]